MSRETKGWRVPLAAVAAILAALWVLPPAVHRALHYCPVRPGGVREVSAVPAFARKYGISCSQCHAAFPTLNDYGREFKNNGYVREREKETGAKIEGSDMMIPGTFPWGALVKARPFDQSKSAGTQRRPQNRAFHELELFLAEGSVAKNFSYFTEIEAEDDAGTGFEPTFEDLRVGYHHNDYLNLIAGFGNFLAGVDPYQTLAMNHHTRRASDTRALLDLDQQYLAVRGEAAKEGVGALGYAFGIGGGRDAPTAGTMAQEGYGPVNYNLRLVADSLKGLALGAFYSFGKDDLTSKATSGTGVNKMQAFAVDALVEAMDLGVRSALVNTKNEVRSTGVLNSKDTGAYVEAFYAFKKNNAPWIVPLVRFDRTKDKVADRKVDHLVANLSYYPLENLRTFLEFYNELSDKTGSVSNTKDSRVTLQFELGF